MMVITSQPGQFTYRIVNIGFKKIIIELKDFYEI